MNELYLNGAFVPPEAAHISVMDRGFLFGDGVYEVIPSYGGHFLGLEPHLDRLDASLAAMRLEAPLAREDWRAVLRRLIGEPPAADQYVYLQVTRGTAPERDHLCPAGVRPTVLAFAKPIKPRAPAIAEQGVACITHPDIRWLRGDIKSISLAAAVLMRREAADADALETIMHRDGWVTEGAVSNVFVVAGGALMTPPKSRLLLSGITRELALTLAHEHGLEFVERPVALDILRAADEIWLSSSTREVLPVTRLDGELVGDGRPGLLWRRMDALYQDYKARVRAGHV
ncbi:D-amino acid aminotransferase [Allochromatium vinosum]|uniref:Aminodeoxychorismate lyase n=1 Tax=Allochromatium vinosum (strain ATCC 17899 / DSM 180 / NBRC 103801 / NCIMB 10441 / D) TaxID=572477 RepID=D3RQT7_ALLVD|nr:D-amino acid aminotransferase [Allochromatium vinosum]ADC63771.1 aminotransferase class IV [Allochromatium vinosum DSM 180]